VVPGYVETEMVKGMYVFSCVLALGNWFQGSIIVLMVLSTMLVVSFTKQIIFVQNSTTIRSPRGFHSVALLSLKK
jgi:hypothetical protein